MSAMNTVTHQLPPTLNTRRDYATDAHVRIIKAATPSALLNMSKENLKALQNCDTETPDWLKTAPTTLRYQAQQLVEESITAHTQLNNAMASIKSPYEFVAPLLTQAIKAAHGLDLNVFEVQVNLSSDTDFQHASVAPASLLEAALHNSRDDKRQKLFSTPHCFIYGTEGERISTELGVEDFLKVCRSLDLGMQYQKHLSHTLKRPDANPELRELFVNYQKSAIEAASYIALHKGDIELKHHTVLTAITSGKRDVRIDGMPVFIRGLSFNDMTMHSCILFEIGDPEGPSLGDVLPVFFSPDDDHQLIAYIPDDPDHPIRHYPCMQAFKDRLREQFARTHENKMAQNLTPYQQFFSRFCWYGNRTRFVSAFIEEHIARDDQGSLRLWDKPVRQQKHDADFKLQFINYGPPEDLWRQDVDLWTKLFEDFITVHYANARKVVVTNADADERDSPSTLDIAFDVILAAMNVLSFAIPPLGVVMLGVSALQLMGEVIEGMVELDKGDKDIGWAHITDVLLNLGIAVASLPALSALQSEFVVIETIEGHQRLWKPDLEPYRRDVSLEGLVTDANGQYQIKGQHYVQIEDGVYERIEDATGRSRITHPSRPQAYQPVIEQDAAGQWRPAIPRPSRTAAPPRGFSNEHAQRLAVKPGEIAGLSPSSKGIYRSADGQHFYIRNIDAQGKTGVYRIRNDFQLGADIVDVTIVDPQTNRASGARLWQAAPDQWQSLSLRGGEAEASAETISTGSAAPSAADRPIWVRPPFSRKRLPNGLWETKIEAVPLNDVRPLLHEWNNPQTTAYAASPADIHQALSLPEFGELTICGDLLAPQKGQYTTITRPFDIASQISHRSGADLLFSMQRMTHSATPQGSFNAIRVVDLAAGELPGQSNVVRGYWAPQGGYVDIPVNPQRSHADHVFTPSFSGCSLVVDQLDESTLRVRHVEAGKEAAQYNDLPAHEHGWGLSTAMEYPDYGLMFDENGNAYASLTGFAYMRYDRSAGHWTLCFQSQRGTPTIVRYSTKEPGWFGKSVNEVRLFSAEKIIRTGSKVVTTQSSPA